MYRRRMKDLEKKNGLWHYDGELFTGLLYDFDDTGLFRSLSHVDAGEITGESDDLMPPLEGNGNLRVDSEYLEEDWGSDGGPVVYSYLGQRLRGVRYDFEGEMLTAEMNVDFGEDYGSGREWHYNGQIACEYNLKKKYDYEWFEDGSIEKRQEESFTLIFSEPNKLWWLEIDDGYPFRQADLKPLQLTDQLSLVGSEINDDIFTFLSKKDGFNRLDLLRLDSVSLSLPVIASINLSNIKKLRFEPRFDEDPTFYRIVLQKLKAKYPQCDIWLDDDCIEIKDH